jgi:hypothetical protein
MPGRHLPPDPSRGDESTLGGYMAVHDRPAAFEGSDGMSYSVEIMTAPTGEPARPWGAFLLFLRWRRLGAQGVEGHLESEFLAHGTTEAEARHRLGAIPLLAAKQALETLLHRDYGGAPTRRWWDVMREDADEE